MLFLMAFLLDAYIFEEGYLHISVKLRHMVSMKCIVWLWKEPSIVPMVFWNKIEWLINGANGISELYQWYYHGTIELNGDLEHLNQW